MKLVENESKNKRYKVLCQSCKNITNHIVLTSIDTSGNEPMGYDEYITWGSIFQIIQCQGCDEISFRNETYNSENYHPEFGLEIDETIYPRRSKETINIKNFFNLPYSIRRIYIETIECYNNELMTLCGAGIRALVEGICKSNKVTDGEVIADSNSNPPKVKRVTNLQGKINGLHEKGILTKENAEILHQHRFLGNEAMHELSQPSKEELSLAISIIEHTLNSIYEIPAKAYELEKVRNKNKKTK